MSALLESFAGGLCFGLGAAVAVMVCLLLLRRNEKEAYQNAAKHYKAVEERLARQADAVCYIAQMMAKEKSK